MENYRVESVFVEAERDRAFRYIADAAHLPEWTHAFKEVRNGRAMMETPAGSVQVSLEVAASKETGTIDWRMTFPDGTKAEAYSRLAPAPAGGCVYSFVLLAPPVPLAQLEGTLNQQADILRQELRKLKGLLERKGQAS
jgi:polyketide cyclase/dehydrase/lipid transport protein